MKDDNIHEDTALVKRTSMKISIGCRVKITKNKRAKSWKILGVIMPLPLLKGEGALYVLSNKNNNIYVYSNQILEVLK